MKSIRELVEMYSKKTTSQLMLTYAELRGRKYAYSSVTDFVGDSLRSFCRYSLPDFIECYDEVDTSETFMLEGMRLGFTSVSHRAWTEYHKIKDELCAVNEVLASRGVRFDSDISFQFPSDITIEGETK